MSDFIDPIFNEEDEEVDIGTTGDSDETEDTTGDLSGDVDDEGNE